MFGYIRPQKAELLVREYEEYKGIYCALCRQLGESYGALSRMALSYDCTFFAIVLFALKKEYPGFESGTCTVNPLKKCVFCKNGRKEIKISAALCVIMTYYKIRDDIEDECLLKKIKAYLCLPFAAYARRKAAQDYVELDKIISVAMLEQAAAEQAEDQSIDYYAESTAKMIEKIMVWTVGVPDLSPKDRVIRQIGYHLGRWVYIIDAADDLEKDFKEKSFNPFLIKYSIKKDALPPPEKFAEIKRDANEILNATLSQLIAAVNVTDFLHFSTIIHNIIEQGLPEMQKATLFEKEKKNVGSL